MHFTITGRNAVTKHTYILRRLPSNTCNSIMAKLEIPGSDAELFMSQSLDIEKVHEKSTDLFTDTAAILN